MLFEILNDFINAFENVPNFSDEPLINKISILAYLITNNNNFHEFLIDIILAWFGSIFNYAFDTILNAFEGLVNNFQNIFVGIGSRFLNSAFTYNAFHSLQDNFVYFIIGLLVFAFMAKIIFNVFKYCIDLIIGLLP